MGSRYDYMTASKYKDDITGEYFPDPSTLNFNQIESNKVRAVELTELTCEKFWTILPYLFNAYDFDDILLSVNRVHHKNFLKPGDLLFSPSRTDIEDSLK